MPPRRVHGVSRKRRVLHIVMAKRAFSHQRRQRKQSCAPRLIKCLLSSSKGPRKHDGHDFELPFSRLRKETQQLLLSDSLGWSLFPESVESSDGLPLRRPHGHTSFLHDFLLPDIDSPILDCGLRQEQVIDLMYRDIKPEDFEILSKLDESLPKRNVVKQNFVDGLPRLLGRDCSSTECGVCLGGLDPDSLVVELPCKHTFHDACITKWLTQCKNTCPICSSPVRSSVAKLNSSKIG